MRFVGKIIGSSNERLLKRLRPNVERINALEPEFEPFSDDDLRRRSGELRGRAEKGEPLDDLLPEAFALVREGGKRTLGQRAFDAQLLGGMVLHQGTIAEMKTGEGKTLAATLPSYLNALSGKGVHVVTVNDYLAQRDAEWMGAIHRLIGLEVGCVVAGVSEAERRAAYQADITYGQNNEFGFDYLRDNMKPSLDLYVQRGHHYAIVDEVDSILIDEARTPLIISGAVDDDPDRFRRIDRIIPRLSKDKDHFTVDEKARQVMLTDEGIAAVEKLLGIDNLYAPQDMETLHVVQNGLRAHVLYQKDVDYVVKDGQVVIVDEFTGRLMEGRRWSDGMHQAIEAKEGVKIQNESQTLASITFQNYFRMYEKLAGMTGTADTEAAEFAEIYKLEVVVVPTNRPMIRADHEDQVYRTFKEKWDAVIDDIQDCQRRGQPVLVGTIAIETSEMLSKRLKNKGIAHNVLNAKQHRREAEIISQAGRLGVTTISTNMAGRGTDIVLGGNAEMMLKARGIELEAPEAREEFEKLKVECEAEREKVVAAGGLHVLGTERHESRRIDNQLRGRSGRQGDPGSSRFYLSLEDDLLRIFGSERIAPLMKRLGMEEGEAIEAKMLSGAIERAQRKVEVRNFDIRKHLLEYDNVMNKQRESIYAWRRNVLGNEDLRGEYLDLGLELADDLVDGFVPEKGEPDPEGLIREVNQQFGITIEPHDPDLSGPLERSKVTERVHALVEEKLDGQVKMFDELTQEFPDLNPPSFQEFGRAIMLQTIDQQWKDHLLQMDHLKEGIGLRGYAQRDPKVEYQREGFDKFVEMSSLIRSRAVEQFYRVVFEVPSKERVAAMRAAEEARRRALQQGLREQHAGGPELGSAAGGPRTVQREGRKVGRNEPCPCGSGKKYKKCHGAAA
ncbi:MAG: preprotein translocase subunit SecA [Myxococcota bacterium]